MLRKIVLGVTAAAAIATPVMALVPSAHAATNRPCISKTEFSKIKKGYSIATVKRIVGGTGSQDLYNSGYPSLGIRPSQTREHTQCGGSYGVHGFADVSYEKKAGVWRVTSKDAFWL
jgi:hypothetical protein